MDDTLWLANSKQELAEILKTATSFFKLTNIKVNPTKSILAITSLEQSLSIIFNNTQIEAISSKQVFRFLGC